MKRIIILLAIMSMFLIGIVNAQSLTLVTTTWGQDGFVNVTLGTPEDCGNTATPYCGNATEFVTLYATCSDTANNTQSLVYNITNSSTTDDSTNFNWGYANFTLGDDLVLEDSVVCSVTGITTGIGDADVITLASTTVIVDRTKPDTPTTTTVSSSVLVDGDVITYTLDGSKTTSCIIAFLSDGAAPRFSGSNTFAMTHSGDTCEYTINKNTLPASTYNVYAQASDGLNSTVSKRIDINLDLVASDSQDLSEGIQIEVAKSAGLTKIKENIGIIAIVLIIAVIVMNQNSKRRK